MALKKYKPVTPGQRFKVISAYDDITTSKPEKSLLAKNHSTGSVFDREGTKMSFIAFGRAPNEFPPPPWDIVYTLHLNTFNNMNIHQLRILDIRSSI